MFLSDYHLHSSFSFDSVQTIEEIAEIAVKKNIHEIAITDHIELAACNLPDCRANILKASEEIDRVGESKKGKLVIRKGIEVGNAHLEPEEAKARSQSFAGDFIIGSVHNLEWGKDVAFYAYSHIDKEKFFSAYLDAVLCVAKSSDYDVLGHITYPLKAMYEQTGTIPDMGKYTEQFRRIFRTVIDRGKGIEVNTSGQRSLLCRLLPDEDLLYLYKECGGTILTLGSDAHKLSDVGEGISDAAKALLKLGFSEITVYEGRKPIPKRIENDGLRRER